MDIRIDFSLQQELTGYSNTLYQIQPCHQIENIVQSIINDHCKKKKTNILQGIYSANKKTRK